MTDGYKKHFSKVKKTAQSHSSVEGIKVSELEKLIQKNQVSSQILMKNEIKKKNEKKLNWKIPSIAFLGILVLTFGLYTIDDIIKYVERMEVSMLSSSHAESPKEDTDKSNQVTNKEELKNENKESTEEKLSSPSKNLVQELEDQKVDHLSYINDRLLQMDEKEKELNKIETELETQRTEVESKIKELQSLRDSISNQLKDKVDIDSQKIDGLVQMYTSMKPPQAAKVFEAMEEDLAVEILARMKRKPAAEVMNLLKPEKAKSISEKQAGYKRR